MEMSYRRINLLTLLILGLVIVLVSIAAYYFTLQIVRGEMRLKNVKLAIPTIAPAKKSRPITARIALLISDYRQKRSGTSNTDNFIKGWQNFFAKENISYDTIRDQDLELNKIKYDILILPYNPSLPELEINRISEFLNNGGGIIACGECGFMDEKGEIRQPTFLNRVLGITKINEIDQSIKSYVPLTLKTNSPLTVDIALGAQLGLTTEYGCVKARIIEERTVQDGYFYDSEVDKGIALEEIKNSTGLCHGSYGKGRFVWLGFNVFSFTGDDFTQKNYVKFLRNVLLWTASKPLARIKTWPKDYHMAVVISGDIEHKFTNVENVIDILQEYRIKGSFFILSDLAEVNVDMVRAMAKNGEIGIHGDEHTVFKGQHYDLQLERLQQAKQVLEGISGQKIIGFRPPYGNYDENTVRALNELGINYLTSSITGGTNIDPYFIPYFEDFVVIPKTNKDDYDLFYRDSITDPEAVLNELKDEFDGLYDLGGFFSLSYHTQILALDTNCGVISDLIGYIKPKNVWIATWQEITDWWRKKRNLELTVQEKGSKQFIVTVTNSGKDAVEDFNIQIFPQIIFPLTQIKSDLKETLKRDFDPQTGSFSIPIKKLEPKAKRRITITLGS
ncbi:MAG: polysaccharide deacetylase family protein [bacterium]